VERSDDRDLVTLVYATPDGERAVRKEVPMTAISQGTVTADEADLEPVETTERYRREGARVRESHLSDDEI